MSIARNRPRSHRRASTAGALIAACVLLAMAATGFGANPTVPVETKVLSTISLTDPVALEAAPPICTDAIAPLDTDDCGDVSFTGGGALVLNLGALSGTDVQAGSLRWKVTTTSPTGYRVRLSNPGTAPVMRSTSSSIADMPSTPTATSAALGATHFGVAVGAAATDSEGAVSYVGSPWLSGDQQGEVFAGVPTGGMVIAERTDPRINDPITVTFAAISITEKPPAPASYSGTVRLVASII